VALAGAANCAGGISTLRRGGGDLTSWTVGSEERGRPSLAAPVARGLHRGEVRPGRGVLLEGFGSRREASTQSRVPNALLHGSTLAHGTEGWLYIATSPSDGGRAISRGKKI